MRFLSISLLLTLLLQSCVKDRPHPPDYQPPEGGGRRVLVANEGAFGNGNASFSVFNPDSNYVSNDVYRVVNGQDVGDVLQSIYAAGNYYFLMVNNSDRILVIDPYNYKLVKSITVHKPRYMVRATDSKLYVTSLYYPEINIIDLNTLTVTGTITTDYPNTEGIIKAGNDVFVCNWDTACNYIYRIDPNTDQITERILLAGKAPSQIVLDKNQKLWVVAGNPNYQTMSSLTQLDLQSSTILKSFTFATSSDIMKPVMNATADTIYYLGVDYSGQSVYNGVFKIGINSDELPAIPFIPAAALQYFWGLGVDTVTGNIYVGDPKGFIQKGMVTIYDPGGNKVRSFDVGLGPGFFLFP